MSKITFREILVDDAELVLSWRTKKRITNYMSTDLNISTSEQKNWIKNSYNINNYYHWMILLNEEPIGTICIKDINLENKSTSWGFYIGNDKYLGYGGFIPPYFYNWVFNNFNIIQIKAYVFHPLVKVIGLHQIHGYNFILEENSLIKKNSKEIVVIAMSLSVDNWKKKRYKKFITEFPVNKWLYKNLII